MTIRCKDRNKLLFDTVCTLADMDYDVYHATIDSQEGIAHQEYYIKPRYGGTGEPRTLSLYLDNLKLYPSVSKLSWKEARALKPAEMMEAAATASLNQRHAGSEVGASAALTKLLPGATSKQTIGATFEAVSC